MKFLLNYIAIIFFLKLAQYISWGKCQMHFQFPTNSLILLNRQFITNLEQLNGNYYYHHHNFQLIHWRQTERTWVDVTEQNGLSHRP
jgi:hypothetical protein